MSAFRQQLAVVTMLSLCAQLAEAVTCPQAADAVTCPCESRQTFQRGGGHQATIGLQHGEKSTEVSYCAEYGNQARNQFDWLSGGRCKQLQSGDVYDFMYTAGNYSVQQVAWDTVPSPWIGVDSCSDDPGCQKLTPAHDDNWQSFNLANGKSLTFYGTIYTQTTDIYVSSNGVISFGGQAPPESGTFGNAANTNQDMSVVQMPSGPHVFLWWDDLHPGLATQSDAGIHYKAADDDSWAALIFNRIPFLSSGAKCEREFSAEVIFYKNPARVRLVYRDVGRKMWGCPAPLPLDPAFQIESGCTEHQYLDGVTDAGEGNACMLTCKEDYDVVSSSPGNCTKLVDIKYSEVYAYVGQAIQCKAQIHCYGILPPAFGDWGNCTTNGVLKDRRTCIPTCLSGFRRIGMHHCVAGVMLETAICEAPAGTMGHPSFGTTDIVSASPSFSQGTAVLPSAVLQLQFNHPVQPGTGSITLTPTSGAALQIAITDSQVAISGNTVTVKPTGGLPQSSPFDTVAVTYPIGTLQNTNGTVVPGCCTRELVASHSQVAGNAGKYYTQTTFTTDWKLDFDLTLHSTQATRTTLFSIGDSPQFQGLVLFQKANSADLELDLVTTAGAAETFLIKLTGLNIRHAIQVVLYQANDIIIRVDGVLQRDASFSSRHMATAVASPTNAPLLVGGPGAGFKLEKMRLTGDGTSSPYRILVEDDVPPSIVSYSPMPGSGSKENPIKAQTDISITFDKKVLPGTGVVAFLSATAPTTEIDISDTSQIILSGKTVTINPSRTLGDATKSTVTMESGVLRSIGAWSRLLVDYEPTSSMALVVATSPFNGQSCATLTEEVCYLTCRQTTNCRAFKTIHPTGSCCLYSSYDFDGGVTRQPNHIFFAVGAGNGLPFVGIAGPEAVLSGTVTLAGPTEAELQDEKAQLALRRALASVSSMGSISVNQTQVALTFPDASARRLLSSTPVSYVVTLTPDQAASAPSAAAALAAALTQGGNFVLTLQTEAQAVGALTVALHQFLSASGGVPAVTSGNAQFSFDVSDSMGPTLISTEPPSGATGIHPSAAIVLVFNEGVQAGAGQVIIENDGYRHRIDIQSNQVRVVGHRIEVRQSQWFGDGLVTITMAPGVVLDDPHEGTPTSNPFVGITGSAYAFNVGTVAVSGSVGRRFLRIGALGRCFYKLTAPYYNCNFEDCVVWLQQMGPTCGDETGGVQTRSISFQAQQTIAGHAIEENGGDGRGAILTYGEGDVWPEYGIADFV